VGRLKGGQLEYEMGTLSGQQLVEQTALKFLEKVRAVSTEFLRVSRLV
jgi:hypothetical protein